MRAGINELEGWLWLHRKIREEVDGSTTIYQEMLALPPSRCVTLDKSLAFSVLPFPMSGK